MAAHTKEFVAHAADIKIAALAGRQHGVVARRQLRELELSDGAIAHRVARGRLHRVHHGVYAVGHPVVSPGGRRMAAVLAAGPGAFLSDAAAAALYGVRRSGASKIDVTVRTSAGRSRPGLRIHRRPSLRPEETTTHEAIPVTTPARTLFDLAATLPTRPLERALEQSIVLGLFDRRAFDALLAAHAAERGARTLRAALETLTDRPSLTRSDLEELFLAVCREHVLPRPKINAYVQGVEVDFLFQDHRLAIEADSWRYHSTRGAFERDRDRDAILARAGYRTLRFSDKQIEHEPRAVAATLAAILGEPPFGEGGHRWASG